MDIHATQQKGDLAELCVAAKLKEYGYTVLFPFTENQSYDLVADTGDEMLRVQVKYASEKDGRVKVTCYGPNSSKTGNNKTFYTPDDIDGIAAYCRDTGNFYWVPVDDINRYTITLSENGKNKFDDFAIDRLKLS